MRRNMDVLVTVLLALQLLAAVRSDFQSDCPALCDCKWSRGLRKADCSNKGYTTIPPNINEDVQVLNLDGNFIKELPKDSFSSVGLKHLQKISLKDCKIQRIDENAFSELKILTEINLDYNNISKLPAKLFDGNERLLTLTLSENQISGLAAHQFPPLRSLKRLDLSSNGMRNIHKKAFMNLGVSLEAIHLHNNQLQNIKGEAFENLHGLKYLSLYNNPWTCDCRLKKMRDLVIKKNLLIKGSETVCAEPERNSPKPWSAVEAQDFACKPEVEIYSPVVVGRPGMNATLRCKITGNPVPGVKWVLNGRILQNNSSPLHAKNPDQVYVIEDYPLAEGGIERNFSLTVTSVTSSDLGQYSCVALNSGGMAESNVTLSFTDPRTDPISAQNLTIIVGVAAGAITILVILIVVLCCCCRKRGKDKTGHSLNGSVLGYTDPAGEKLLPQNGTLPTINRANPLPKPHRTGEYHHGHGQHAHHQHAHGHEMVDYGPASYVPGDRYDEYGDGRGGSSNSDQTGTLSRASYHSSDPDHYPDLLDIPNRMKQPSPSSTVSTMLYGHIGHNMGPHIIDGHHHGHHGPQPLHPTHLMSPPGAPGHVHHHHMSPFQRTGTLPHNFSTGTLPHNHHPRSVSCDHSNAGGYGPIVQTSHGQRPGYVTLPRRPRASWAGQQAAAAAGAMTMSRDTPSPGSQFSLSLRADPIYDGVGPRTSADGSSVVNLNKSVDNAMIPPKPMAGMRLPTLPPLIPPIKEENHTPVRLQQTNGTNSSPNILDMSEQSSQSGPVKTSTAIHSQLSVGSSATLNEPEENLSAYFEPFGSALVPSSPGNRDSIASCESDSLLIVEKKDDAEIAAHSTPRQNGHTHTPPLPSIPEMEPIPADLVNRKQPPPTLPKPKKITKVSPPAPPPKPKPKPVTDEQKQNGSDIFQDETFDGSEV